jgi:radical SAM superfamily enzyme YgiQ (UPF0313 family)
MPKNVPLVTYAVQSNGPVLSGMMLDNGVALMAAHLRRRGYEPKVFDYNSLQAVERIARAGHDAFVDDVVSELVTHVAETGAKMIGFKLYLNGFRDALRIAKRVKDAHPGLVVVGGGPQVDWFMEGMFEIVRRRNGTVIFDALVYGDADVALVELAESVYATGADFGGIANLLLPRGGVEGGPRRTPRRYYDMRDLPFPDYSPEIYDTTGKILIPVIEDSRSCDVACTFCIQPRIGGRRRERGTEDVLAELAHYRKTYGWHLFRLAGPKPTAAYLGELARAMPADCRFSAFGYADQDYGPVVETGKLLGLFTGLESTSPQVLERVYRKTDDTPRYLDAARRMIGDFKGRGLVNVVSMIVPSPGDTAATMRASLDFLIDVAPDFVPCLPVGPMPGTPLTRLAKTAPDEAGVLLDDDYEQKLAEYETDLLRPPASWPAPPWQVKVDGKWVRNAFAEVTAPFVDVLMQHGMHILSDEQVLMAYLFHRGLSADQTERRRQCVEFNQTARAAIEGGDAATLGRLVERVNGNQLRPRDLAGTDRVRPVGASFGRSAVS